MKILLSFLIIFSTFTLKANDTIKIPNWSIYANGSIYSIVELHAGFEKYFGNNKSVSFDLAWRHIKPSLACYPPSINIRKGAYLVASYNIHNNKPKQIALISGFGLFMGYFYINNYGGTPCHPSFYIGSRSEKVPSIGLISEWTQINISKIH